MLSITGTVRDNREPGDPPYVSRESVDAFLLSCIPIRYGLIRTSPALESLSVWKVHKSVRKYVVWLLPGGADCFTGIFWDAEICPGFQPSSLLHLVKGLWVVWCNK